MWNSLPVRWSNWWMPLHLDGLWSCGLWSLTSWWFLISLAALYCMVFEQLFYNQSLHELVGYPVASTIPIYGILDTWLLVWAFTSVHSIKSILIWLLLLLHSLKLTNNILQAWLLFRINQWCKHLAEDPWKSLNSFDHYDRESCSGWQYGNTVWEKDPGNREGAGKV